MSKLRVYEVARDLGMDNKSLVSLFQSIGVMDVRNHMSAVGPEQIERAKRQIEKQSAQKSVEQRIRPTVIKRRSKPREGEEGVESTPAVSEETPATPARTVVRRPAAGAIAKSSPTHAAPAAPQVAAASAPMAPIPAEPVAPPSALRSSPGHAAVEEAPSIVSSEPAAPAAVLKSAPSNGALASSPAQQVPSAPVSSSVKESATPDVAFEPEPSVKEAVSAAEPPIKAVAEASEAPVVSAPVERPTPSDVPPRPAAPKTGIDVWEGRPGVPMPAPRVSPRRVQYDAKSGMSGAVGGSRRPAPNQVAPAGRMGGGGPGGRGGGGPRRGIGSFSPRRAGAAPVTQERSAHKKVVKIEESINLQGLAGKIGVKAGEVLMKLMSLGMTGVNINTTLDSDTAKLVANEFGWEVEDVAVSEEAQITAAQGADATEDDAEKEHRPPVVTVMGHVDHGKTSLLDRIRKTQVATGEAGGITQHIGAYSVETSKGKITFLDTPGHAAFTAMRARGAQTTDIVILVVAADDGVMPQTKEAVDHARAAKVPIVVAVNKIDKPDAQPERVRRELADIGLVPEEWGGDTLFCEVSAATGAGIEKMLESVALQAELLELKANPNKPASGVVIEAKLDRGRGPVATILVQEGTLTRGDVLLAGSAYGKVRAILDERGRQLAKAGPSTPVEVVGLDDIPSAGDPVHSFKDLKKAQEIAATRKHKERRSLMPTTSKVSLEDLQARMNETEQLELKVIIKADVQGSVEALVQALNDLSTAKVRVIVVHAGVGAITEGDVNLGVAAKSIIVGFNVRPAGKAASLAQKEGIEIRQYSIIYDVSDDIKLAMEGLLAPTLVEKPIGKAEVRKLFRTSKSGTVAGCMVVSGAVRRNAGVRIFRNDAMVWEGKLESLKRFKDDAKEVREGFDCGMSFAGFSELEEGDRVEAFELQEVRQSL